MITLDKAIEFTPADLRAQVSDESELQREW
jgi:hypothetical protein